MKKTKINLFFAMAAALVMSACNTDDVQPAGDNSTAPLPSEMATVRFAMKAPQAIDGVNTKAIQEYLPANFRVLAFRHNGTDYVYTDDVKFNNDLKYENKAFTGTAELPVGVYKFIPAYGLPTATNTDVELSELTKQTVLDANITATHLDVLPAIFLRENDQIPSDTLGTETGRPNQVSASIKRAVARLDVMFVPGSKATGEVAGEDIFTGYTLDSIVVSLDKVTSTAQLFDGAGVYANTMATKHVVNLGNIVKSDGTLTTPSTVGTGEKYNFDAVKATDIIQGGQYAYGPNLFPFADETTTANMTLRVKSKADANGHVYERTIDIPGIKLIRNKVTMVKVYAKRGNFFDTEVTFNVSVKEAWEGSFTTEGETN